MSIPGSANPLLAYKSAAAATYSIPRSVRLNAADSAYFSRTPASAGNRKTWTWAGWVKRSGLGQIFRFFGQDSYPSYTYCSFTNSDKLSWINNIGGSTVYGRQSIAVYRDTSAWMHVVFVNDTAASVASDRVKLYVNGGLVQTELLEGAYDYPAQNTDGYINAALPHYINYFPYIGAGSGGTGLLADVHFIDGQALTPSSFGEFDTNGIWQPKAYTGTYGTNGFHLDFADNSAATAATLGKDTSGNGNNWTPNNLSVTAGAGNDSLVDSPTNGTASSGGDAGGVVVGNYATLNPLAKTAATPTFANGNLDASGTDAQGLGTIAVTSGKWYAECVYTTVKAGADNIVGVQSLHIYGSTTAPTPLRTVGSVGYDNLGSISSKVVDNGFSSYGASWTANDVIGIALDLDGNQITFYKNGVSQGAISYTFSTYGPWVFANGSDGSTGTIAFTWNFGQRPFAYAAPSGFKSLNTANLPTPTILKGSDYFDTKLYTGNGSTQTISGLGFSPDLVWIKSRSAATSNGLLDTIRGANKVVYSNLTAAEDTYTNTLTSFNSDGFSLGADSWGGVNTNSSTYAAWCWDAGTANVTNTQGSITSTVRANPSAGFSIVTYTGNATGSATVGHGLNATVQMYFLKGRDDGTSSWIVGGSTAIGFALGDYLRLNTTDAKGATTSTDVGSPNSSTIYVNVRNSTGQRYVAYCFAPVSGYSSFGSYTGNGSSDGPLCWCGFRPRFILQKRSDSTGSWQMWDTARNTYNETRNYLLANTSDAEANNGGGSGAWQLDILSNGFKIRADGVAAQMNANGGTYVWAAFAENPFSIARAR